MKRFIVAMALMVGGCVSSHAVLRTEVVLNGKNHSGEIFCTDGNGLDCQKTMTDFCGGAFNVIKDEPDRLCYMVPVLTTGKFSTLSNNTRLKNLPVMQNYEQSCDVVQSINFACE